MIHVRSRQMVQCDPVYTNDGFYSCLFAFVFEGSEHNSTLIVYPRPKDKYTKVAFRAEYIDSDIIETNDMDSIKKSLKSPKEVYDSFNGKRYYHIDKLDITHCILFMVTSKDNIPIQILSETFRYLDNTETIVQLYPMAEHQWYLLQNKIVLHTFISMNHKIYYNISKNYPIIN